MKTEPKTETMTTAHCRRVVEQYAGVLGALRPIPGPSLEHVRHAVGMLPRMREMLAHHEQMEALLAGGGLDMDDETRTGLVHVQHALREQFMRWLGFMQGVLYTERVFSVDQMREHNRP